LATRIEDYGMIGDLHTAALVGADGAIDWLCLPRFDSPACFSALLGDDENGSWRLGPVSGGPCTRRRYRGDTLILETEWDTPEGSVRVTDAMPPRDGAADLVRVVEGLSGRVPMRTTMRLRFGYGRVEPWIRCRGTELAAIAGPDAAWLDADVPLEVRDASAGADFEVAAGERVAFTLIHEQSHLDRPKAPDPVKALAHTEAFWTDWIGGLRYEGEWDEAVRRSLIILKALTYDPTGGIAAAATTSLPEDLGGVRNWDYRFCWLRDAAFVLQALLGTGFIEEASAWRQWLLRAAAGDPAELQIMYGLDGQHWLPEHDLDWLSGYEGSSPVRIGNAATRQFQLDVWGETLDALHLARAADLEADEIAWDLQKALLNFLERLGEPGRQPVGDPRRAPPLRALEGHGLGRVRPRRAGRRAVRAERPGRPLAGAARPRPRGRVRARLRSSPRHVHPVLRLEGARRGVAAHPAGGLPAVGRPARGRHGGVRPEGAVARRVPAAVRRRGRRRRGRAPRRRRRVPGVHVLARRRPAGHRPRARGPGPV
jgi:GH15 family glucan-1,4-alpha-glucosidase